MSAGIQTWSMTSTPIGFVGAPWPEHLHAPSGAARPLAAVHSGGSSHTGSKLAPKFSQPQSAPPRAGARGRGFFLQLEPGGSVPTFVSQPSAELLK